MKKFILVALIISSAFGLKADFRNDTIRNKKDGGYFFSEITKIDHNIVQNQCRTGTCWSYSSLSFFESELIRMGKPKVNLSEMFMELFLKQITMDFNMVRTNTIIVK